MWGSYDFTKLKKICSKRKIFILEDAAEALGSYVKKDKIMHCGSIGDIVFHLMQIKLFPPDLGVQ